MNQCSKVPTWVFSGTSGTVPLAPLNSLLMVIKPAPIRAADEPRDAHQGRLAKPSSPEWE